MKYRFKSKLLFQFLYSKRIPSLCPHVSTRSSLFVYTLLRGFHYKGKIKDQLKEVYSFCIFYFHIISVLDDNCFDLKDYLPNCWILLIWYLWRMSISKSYVFQ